MSIVHAIYVFSYQNSNVRSVIIIVQLMKPSNFHPAPIITDVIMVLILAYTMIQNNCSKVNALVYFVKQIKLIFNRLVKQMLLDKSKKI
jgi:hypothetical protein